MNRGLKFAFLQHLRRTWYQRRRPARVSRHFPNTHLDRSSCRHLALCKQYVLCVLVAHNVEWRDTLLKDTRGMAFSLYRLASMSSERGNFSSARSLYEETLGLLKEMGDQERICWALAQLAGLESIQGEHTRARQLFEESLSHFRQLRNKEGVAWTLFNLAWALFVAQHDPATVRSLLAESLVLCKELGARDSIASCLCYSGIVALNLGAVATARSFLEESVALNREIGNQRALSRSLCGLASFLAVQGDIAAARALYEESLYLATEVDAKPIVVFALEGVAGVIAAQHEPAAAAQLWGAAETLRDLMGMPIPPMEYAAYNRSVTTVRIRLGKQAFTTAWAQGRTTLQEQIVSISEPLKALTPSVVWLPFLPQMRSSPQESTELTKREIEILRLLATGLTSAQIAEYLTISVLTVNSHVRSIYSKLRVTSRSAATRYAIEQKLV
jgi:ATP/maltotriose-dependent transcriptional regulator MalT